MRESCRHTRPGSPAVLPGTTLRPKNGSNGTSLPRTFIVGPCVMGTGGIGVVGNTIALAPVDLNALAKFSCSNGRVTETSARYWTSVGTILFVAAIVVADDRERDATNRRRRDRRGVAGDDRIEQDHVGHSSRMRPDLIKVRRNGKHTLRWIPPCCRAKSHD